VKCTRKRPAGQAPSSAHGRCDTLLLAPDGVNVDKTVAYFLAAPIGGRSARNLFRRGSLGLASRRCDSSLAQRPEVRRRAFDARRTIGVIGRTRGSFEGPSVQHIGRGEPRPTRRPDAEVHPGEVVLGVTVRVHGDRATRVLAARPGARVSGHPVRVGVNLDRRSRLGHAAYTYRGRPEWIR